MDDSRSSHRAALMDTIQQRDASSAVAAAPAPTVRLRMLSDQLVGTAHHVAGEVVEVPAGRLVVKLQAAGLAEPCDDEALPADPAEAITVDVAGPAAGADDPPPAEDAAAKARKAVEAARAKAAARGSK